MGLLKAGAESLRSTLADQWKEYFYCDALPNDVLMRRGYKKTGKNSSNTKGNDNIITDGSVIAVADGQAMLIVDQGKVAEFCAEPGEFIYDRSSEPSIFTGGLGKGIVNSFKTMGRRFTFGGDTGKDQRVYYINTKEIIGNKFGTPSPIIFEVVNSRIGMSKTVNVRCNGLYSYVISDPIVFYTKLCGNVANEYTKDNLDEQLRTEFIDALQPAFGELAEQELKPAQIPAKANILKQAMNNALKQEWTENRGITIAKIALNPITLNDEDMKKIAQLEDSATLGSNPFMMAGRMTDATANAYEGAANNSAGAMTGFLGMGMAGGNNGFNAAQNFYSMGMENRVKQEENNTAGQWTCSCGTVNTGKFCQNCGKPKSASGKWTCSCGTINAGNFCTNCGKPKPSAKKCPECGWEAKPGEDPKFCPNCGHPLK